MKSKCPFYEEIKMRYCKAFEKRILVPNGSGKEKYCTCQDYVDCPVYHEFFSKEVKVGTICEDEENTDS
ncbi:MAG: hypothetical protein A2Y62_16500 [Candidatus Fischerbacteria bacterium RBG_13_37_8]|uniref:Uncharacterized protein n=1 Tax=Candidatus Fischerbacteria bacterium RBG_13_37_8 TaxID=1817863 RepID=A0A1F5VJA0_9BACT|nr:MAG: hypothetical protein A2Y62_16500 [Candidatus Fischerbacteria bacterium RBG_13_37_8]